MTISTQLRATSSLLDAAQVVGNWRALLLQAATLVVAMLVFGVSMMAIAVGFPPLGLLGWLVSLAVLFYGTNAVGIMLMDACRMGVPATAKDAIKRALTTGHRVLGMALVAAVALLAVSVLVAVALLLCKIPVLGPVLYTVVLPLSTVLLGVTAFTLFYVYMPLAACAIWTGASIAQAASNLVAIVRQRLMTIALQECVLLLIASVVSAIIGAVLFLGYSLTMNLSAIVISGPQLLMGLLPGLHLGALGAEAMGMMNVGGYVLAAVLGSFLLFALASAIPGLILTQGFCQIYLSATDALASELPGTPGDDTLNTAARLRAAEEAARAREVHTAAGAATAAGVSEQDSATGRERIEPVVDPVATQDESSAAPAASATPAVSTVASAAQPITSPATPSAAGAGSVTTETTTESPAPTATAEAPAAASDGDSNQQSLGFDDDNTASGSASSDSSEPAPKP